MALEKLKITPLAPSKLEEISVLFNPNSYSITKSVTWSLPQTQNGSCSKTQRQVNAPTLTFGGGGSRQLSLELFFDITEPIDGRPPVEDVRQETDKIVRLTRIERKRDRPPTCKIAWGKALTTDFPFIGVVSNLTQKFTLFKSDGTPVRANLTVVFVEFLAPKQDQHETDPEMTTRVVKQGDTLSSITAEVYRDPTLWRIIAEANHLDNPRQMEIGRMLTIPKVR